MILFCLICFNILEDFNKEYFREGDGGCCFFFRKWGSEFIDNDNFIWFFNKEMLFFLCLVYS